MFTIWAFWVKGGGLRVQGLNFKFWMSSHFWMFNGLTFGLLCEEEDCRNGGRETESDSVRYDTDAGGESNSMTLGKSEYHGSKRPISE